MAVVTSYIKGEFFLNNLDAPAGVSEVYYPNGGTDDDCAAQMVTLWALRREFLPVNWQLAYGRVSATGKPRDSVPMPTGIGEAGTYVLAPGVLLPTDSCVLFSIIADAFSKNKKFFHGVTSNDVDNGDTFNPSVTYANALTAFLNELIIDFQVITRHIVPPAPWDKMSYDTAPIASGTALRLTNHKAGRPFGVFRGRRRRVM